MAGASPVHSLWLSFSCDWHGARGGGMLSQQRRCVVLIAMRSMRPFACHKVQTAASDQACLSCLWPDKMDLWAHGSCCCWLLCGAHAPCYCRQQQVRRQKSSCTQCICRQAPLALSYHQAQVSFTQAEAINAHSCPASLSSIQGTPERCGEATHVGRHSTPQALLHDVQPATSLCSSQHVSQTQ